MINSSNIQSASFMIFLSKETATEYSGTFRFLCGYTALLTEGINGHSLYLKTQYMIILLNRCRQCTFFVPLKRQTSALDVDRQITIQNSAAHTCSIIFEREEVY